MAECMAVAVDRQPWRLASWQRCYTPGRVVRPSGQGGNGRIARAVARGRLGAALKSLCAPADIASVQPHVDGDSPTTFRLHFARTIAVAVLACSLSGCLSALVEEKRIGSRGDRLEYDRAVRSGDRLFLFYCFRRGARPCDPKWSVIDLTGIAWTELCARHPIERQFLRPSIEDGPRPAIDSDAVELPIVPLAATNNSMDLPGGPSSADLRARSAGYRLSLYREAISMFLVSREQAGARCEAVFVQAMHPSREYLTWWAIPTRASLYAVTVPIDVAASPLELLGLWLFARGMRE